MYIFIQFHIVNQYHTKSDIFLAKITNVMIRFNRNDSLTVSCCHLLADLISHLKYLFTFFIHSNISIQRFSITISKHYLYICNSKLNVFMSCIKQCVNKYI